MKIFINPGHGGSDPGACGNGLREADVALKIATNVDTYLRRAGCDVKTFQFDGLQQICDAANDWQADLFVSIHCNAANSLARGTETYFFASSSNGKKLADKIQRQIVTSLPVTNRGIKTANFYVLHYTDMPAVLVETAFIDNPDDAYLLRFRHDDFARAIARGVTDFLTA